MNTEKLQQLNVLFSKELQEERLAGASIVVERRGKELFRNHYGCDRPDSIYKIFSMTKPITAVAFMMLYEKGLVDFYDSIGDYLPGFADMKVWTEHGLVPADSKITISQVLNMTSGLTYTGELCEPDRIMERIHQELTARVQAGEKLTNLQVLDALSEAPLVFQPGAGWNYGISADVVAGIVEVVTGIPYGEYLKKTIFEPLEMQDTGFYVPESQSARLTKYFTRTEDKGKLIPADATEMHNLTMDTPFKQPPFESGGGGLYSTMEDYLHFAQMLIGKGVFRGKRLLGRKTVEFMAMNNLTETQRSYITWDSLLGYGYGNLVRVLIDKQTAASNGSLGEYGWDGLAGTYFMIDPEEELIVVYMQAIAQGADPVLRRKMRQIIYGALE